MIIIHWDSIQNILYKFKTFKILDNLLILFNTSVHEGSSKRFSSKPMMAEQTDATYSTAYMYLSAEWHLFKHSLNVPLPLASNKDDTWKYV